MIEGDFVELELILEWELDFQLFFSFLSLISQSLLSIISHMFLDLLGESKRPSAISLCIFENHHHDIGSFFSFSCISCVDGVGPHVGSHKY